MNRAFRITLHRFAAFGLLTLFACGGGGGGGTPSPTISSVTVTPNPGAVNLMDGDKDVPEDLFDHRDLFFQLPYLIDRCTAHPLAHQPGAPLRLHLPHHPHHLRVTHANRRNRYEVTGLLPLHPGDDAARTMTDLALRLSSLTMSAFASGLSIL